MDLSSRNRDDRSDRQGRERTRGSTDTPSIRRTTVLSGRGSPDCPAGDRRDLFKSHGYEPVARGHHRVILACVRLNGERARGMDSRFDDKGRPTR